MQNQSISVDVGVATLSEHNADGFLTVQHDAYGDEGSDSMPLSHTYGFVSRPRDPVVGENGQPNQGEGCNLLVLQDGTQQRALLLEDPRYVNPVPLLDKGGSAQYAVTDEGQPSYHLIYAEDGTQQIYVPVGTDKAHQVTIGKDGAGEPTLELIHADGMAVVMFDGKVVLKGSGDAYIEVGPSGVTINGALTLNGGLAAGGLSGQPLLMVNTATANAIVGAMAASFAPLPGSPGTAAILLALTAAGTVTTKAI
jgi:hypothetical protein